MSNSGGGGGLGEPGDVERTLADIDRTLGDGATATDPPAAPDAAEPKPVQTEDP